MALSSILSTVSSPRRPVSEPALNCWSIRLAPRAFQTHQGLIYDSLDRLLGFTISRLCIRGRDLSVSTLILSLHQMCLLIEQFLINSIVMSKFAWNQSNRTSLHWSADLLCPAQSIHWFTWQPFRFAKSNGKMIVPPPRQIEVSTQPKFCTTQSSQEAVLLSQLILTSPKEHKRAVRVKTALAKKSGFPSGGVV